MKKNLKSVISFVIALALSAGSVGAFAATNYTDVPADASYAEAVANLTAIGIVEGDGDGTFRPDDKITRAEVAAMVVRAMAQNDAAISSKGATNFTDVAADNWASGYINVASRGSSAFINGMGDGTFAPQNNVTYAQIVKMVVAAIGYGDWGIAAGGYPTGYIATAKQIGITDGITGVNAEDEVSRAVVAQLINNAIDTPLLALKTYSPTNPEYVVMDGTDDNDYETVLTYYHNIYKVEGRVLGTSKSDSTIETDEVKYGIEVTKNYNDSDIVLKKADKAQIPEFMKIGDTDVADYLNVFSKILVKVEDDEDPIILSCVASGKNTTTTLNADAWDDEKHDTDAKAIEEMLKKGNKGNIWYYANSNKSGKSSRYYLADNFNLYVNGVKLTSDDGAKETDADYMAEVIQKYILDNTTGTVTLVDTPDETSSSTDGKYDAIFVSYYGTAVVDSVNSNGKVYFDDSFNTDGKSAMEFDDDDEDYSYSITFNGEEISWADLQQDDVISIAYNVDEGFSDSKFYDVIVSRDVVEGKITEHGEDKDEIGVDGTMYKLVDKEAFNLEKDFELGSSYSMLVDSFGRVVKQDKLATSVLYGIVNRAWPSSESDENKISIIDATAVAKSYEFADTFTYVVDSETEYKGETAEDEIMADFGEKANDQTAMNRVVEYEVNKNGEIKKVTILNGNESTDPYVEKSNKIGTLKFDDATVIISVEGKDFTKVSTSSLTDDADYTAFGYDKDDGTYGFILITSDIGGIVDDTRFAVVEKVTQGTNDEGEDCDKIQLYNADSKELQTVYTDDKDVAYGKLEKGDVIVYSVNENGEIEDDKFTVVFSAGSSYTDYIKEASSDSVWYTNNKIDPAAGDLIQNNPWLDKDDDENEIEMYFGVVVNKSNSGITLSMPSSDNLLYIDEVSAATSKVTGLDYDLYNEFDYDSEVAVYVYDYNNNKSNRLSVGTAGSVAKINVASEYKDEDKTYIDLTELYEEEEDFEPVYALVKVNDDNVTDVFVIIPNDDK